MKHCTVYLQEYYLKNKQRIKQRSHERYVTEKFFRENPSHWVTRLFVRCPQCRLRKFVTCFSDDNSPFCDQCLSKRDASLEQQARAKAQAVEFRDLHFRQAENNS